MKKVKILSLLLAALMLTLAFTACSNADVASASSFNDLYNGKYVPTDEIYSVAQEIDALDNAVCVDYNDELILFTTGEGNTLVYKVYSFEQNTVIKTFACSVDGLFSVRLCGDLPAFFVTKTSSLSLETPTYTYTLYDAYANTLATNKEDVGSPLCFENELIYNRVVYTLDKEGALVETEETIPETLSVIAPNLWNDKYIYELGATSFNVYDRRFNPVSGWTAPSFASDIEINVLANGNILVQYVKELEPSVDEYDFFEYTNDGNVEKFDLVSVVVNANTGKEKAVEMDYFVSSIFSNDYMSDLLGENVLNKKVENIALINKIVDKQLDTSENSTEIVIINGDCTSIKSLKIADQQTADLPIKIAKNTFLIQTAYGSAITKANGKVIFPLTNEGISANSQYIIGHKAIYDISSLEVIYDLEENDAEIVGVFNTAVFFKEGNDIFMLRDGEATSVGTIPAAMSSEEAFVELEGVGAYALYDSNSAEFTYYTLDGEKIMSSKTAMKIVAASAKYDTLIICGTGDAISYSTLTRAAE